jgi:hypothetical protein
LALTVLVRIACVLIGEMPGTNPRIGDVFFGFALAVSQ